MLDRLKFNGAPVIVTGGGSGIGQACCEVLAELGATVIMVGRTEAKLRETESLIARFGVETLCHVADVSNEDEVAGLRDVVAERWGHVKALINNAGDNFQSNIEELETADWNRILGVNLDSLYYFAKLFLPLLKAAPGGGAMVNTASTFGVVGNARMPAYSAAKGGMLALTRQLAIDYGEQGMRINAICPGPTLTARIQGYVDRGLTDIDHLGALTCMGRMAEPREIADVMAFMASDAASYMNGATVIVDGGYTAK